MVRNERLLVNRTTALTLYAPIVACAAYLIVLFTNLGNTRETTITMLSNAQEVTGYYTLIATVSVAIMGFLIVAMPLIGQMLSSEHLGRVFKEFERKGGIAELLKFFIVVIVLSTATLSLSVISLIASIASNLYVYATVSSFMIISLVYLLVSMYVLYNVIRATNPQLRIGKSVSVQP